MQYQKGLSGNPKGRPIGSKNKVGQDLRKLVTNLLEQQFAQAHLDFEQLIPHQRVRMLVELLPFAIPKMKEIDTTIKLEQLSDADLDTIINKIIGSENTNIQEG